MDIIMGTKTIIRNSASVTIDGKTFKNIKGTMEINSKGIFVDGKPLEEYKEPPVVKVIINGNVESIETENADVEVKGSVNTITSKNGNISCQEVKGNLETKNGNVCCGRVGGDVTTKNGNIIHS